jgi:V/A-type H+-transporting ATPase subunit E
MGIDTILEDIRAEAEASVSDILTAAGVKADAVMKEAAASADRAAEQLRKENDRRVEDVKARSASTLQLRRRQRVLSVKQELIASAMQRVTEAVDVMPADRYFTAILHMAAAAAHTGSGTIAFGEKDRKRLPADFAEQLEKKLPAGAELKIADRTADIRDGFILTYSGIEENCSFDAILSARREEMQDLIAGILFSD